MGERRFQELLEWLKKTSKKTSKEESSKEESVVVKKIRELVQKDKCVLKKYREDAGYKGQAAIHIAICRESIAILNTLLVTDKVTVKDMLRIKATGKKFKKTAMLGELPLVVAALTLNKGKTLSRYDLST